MALLRLRPLPRLRPLLLSICLMEGGGLDGGGLDASSRQRDVADVRRPGARGRLVQQEALCTVGSTGGAAQLAAPPLLPEVVEHGHDVHCTWSTDTASSGRTPYPWQPEPAHTPSSPEGAAVQAGLDVALVLPAGVGRQVGFSFVQTPPLRRLLLLAELHPDLLTDDLLQAERRALLRGA
ncbi:hypothetical protein EYF80_051249 [Liparis tanakae]|uniref:Uncharacterized protein n=1 Tax=Liparis tanakae TaxID=230148 RepID=A0A4Z2FBF9_9TELE|nr:hypothetical protein EYF80_051249 [Liparis tanakae]